MIPDRPPFEVPKVEHPKVSFNNVLSFLTIINYWLNLERGGANGEMANLTNEKGKFAIAIFRHFSPFFAIFRHW